VTVTGTVHGHEQRVVVSAGHIGRRRVRQMMGDKFHGAGDLELLPQHFPNPLSPAHEDGSAQIVVQSFQNRHLAPQPTEMRAHGEEEIPDDTFIDAEHPVTEVDVLVQEVAPFACNRYQVELIRTHPCNV
jgi:hypothetical protein